MEHGEHREGPPVPKDPFEKKRADRESDKDEEYRRQRALWWHPATIIAIVITVSLVGFIGANVLNWDPGRTLARLSTPAFARGLITYIFAISTTSAFTTIILTALLSQGTVDERIGRAKDILALLLGVFGTIVGYYFGTQEGTASQFRFETASAESGAAPGDTVSIRGSITDGTGPFTYWVALPAGPRMETTNSTIHTSVVIPPDASDFAPVLVVRDVAGVFATEAVHIRLKHRN